MTIKEAIDDIQEHGINFCSSDFVSMDALKIAVEVMQERIEYDEGFAPVLDVAHYDRTSDKCNAHIRSRCGHCNALLKVDIYPTDIWNKYIKDSYNPELPNFCANCGGKVRVDTE